MANRASPTANSKTMNHQVSMVTGGEEDILDCFRYDGIGYLVGFHGCGTIVPSVLLQLIRVALSWTITTVNLSHFLWGNHLQGLLRDGYLHSVKSNLQIVLKIVSNSFLPLFHRG